MRIPLRLLTAVLVCAFGQSAAAGDTLTLTKCIDLALVHSPVVMGAQGASLTARGTYEAGRAALLPQAGLSSSITENQGNPAGSRGGSSETYALSAQVQELLFDFGKSIARTRAVGALWNAASSDAESVRQNLILAVHVSYFGLLEAHAIDSVAAEAAKQADAHLNQTKQLLDAGRGVRFDIVKAQVDAENAKLVAARAHNAVAVARVQLENTVGMPLGGQSIGDDGLDERVAAPLLVDSALSLALRNRPDVQAARLRLTASEFQVQAARRSLFPSLAANAGYGFQTSSLTATWSNGWSAGLGLTAPLYQGGALRGGMRQAQGNLLTARALVAAVEQSVILDVQQQHLLVGEASQRIDIARKTVELATLALTLAQERFAAGAGNALEMSDAELSLSNAKVAYIQARADYRISCARLHRALGDLRGAATP